MTVAAAPDEGDQTTNLRVGRSNRSGSANKINKLDGMELCLSRGLVADSGSSVPETAHAELGVCFHMPTREHPRSCSPVSAWPESRDPSAWHPFRNQGVAGSNPAGGTMKSKS